MIESLKRWLRALALLRDPEAYGALAELLQRRHQRAAVLSRFPDVKIAADLRWIAYAEDRIKLGRGITLSAGCVLSFGDDRNGYGRIEIGEGSWLGEYNNLRACGGGDVVIGRHCLISQFCTLVASNHAAARNELIQSQGPDPARLGVDVGDDVWLGAGVAVLPGVHIGSGAIVGANAVVACDVPAYEIWVGIPARRIGRRE